MKRNTENSAASVSNAELPFHSEWMSVISVLEDKFAFAQGTEKLGNARSRRKNLKDKKTGGNKPVEEREGNNVQTNKGNALRAREDEG